MATSEMPNHSLETVFHQIRHLVCQLNEIKDAKKRLLKILNEINRVEELATARLQAEIDTVNKLKLTEKQLTENLSADKVEQLLANEFLSESLSSDTVQELSVDLELTGQTTANSSGQVEHSDIASPGTDIVTKVTKQPNAIKSAAAIISSKVRSAQNNNNVGRKINSYQNLKSRALSRLTVVRKADSLSRAPTGGKPNFLCFMCNRSFPGLIERRKHEREDHLPTDKMIYRPKFRKPKRFNCPVCNETFHMCHEMQRHAREVHYANDPNRCDECGKTFVSRFNLRAHKKLHSEEKPFCCAVCDKGFKTNSQLRKHRYIHTGEKRYKCSECDQMFMHTFQRRIHMMSHTGEAPEYVCSECNYESHFRGSLAKHMRIHTGEKPYLCSDCGKSFADPSAHKTHMMIHSGLRPFSCSDCSKTFRLKAQLKLHKRIHSGEKRYACAVCGVRYMYSKGLRDHMEKHTGETRYIFPCTQCNRKFITATNLEQHMQRHNENIKEQTIAALEYFVEGSF